MAHVPEDLEQYICARCQVTHAGTPVRQSGGQHSFEAPESCGACGAEEFVSVDQWIRHHE